MRTRLSDRWGAKRSVSPPVSSPVKVSGLARVAGRARVLGLALVLVCQQEDEQNDRNDDGHAETGERAEGQRISVEEGLQLHGEQLRLLEFRDLD